jgi:ABC-2 type transport system ATP-binding protein
VTPSTATAVRAPSTSEPAGAASLRPAIEVVDVAKRFGQRQALARVTLDVAEGEIHALLGPNGAGKTTLLRILSGLVTPDSGTVHLLGARPTARNNRLGLVPAGERSFYQRISALENLVFFARLHGLRRRDAVARASAGLEEVGLGGDGAMRVGNLSKGMQRRLAVARAMLAAPRILLVDEATHDLDPTAARQVRELVGSTAASRNIAVVWATQRLEEIAGFARRVTLLDAGETRFSGSVDALMEHSLVRRYVLTIRSDELSAGRIAAAALAALGATGTLAPVVGDVGRYVLEIDEETVLGDALAALSHAGLGVVACRPDRSEIEEAFVALTRRSDG